MSYSVTGDMRVSEDRAALNAAMRAHGMMSYSTVTDARLMPWSFSFADGALRVGTAAIDYLSSRESLEDAIE